jgi:hypothetical protein
MAETAAAAQSRGTSAAEVQAVYVCSADLILFIPDLVGNQSNDRAGRSGTTIGLRSALAVNASCSLLLERQNRKGIRIKGIGGMIQRRFEIPIDLNRYHQVRLLSGILGVEVSA